MSRTQFDFTPGKPIRTYGANGSWRDWSTDELVGAKLNYLSGWKCGAGVDSLFIDMDGGVWTASCRVGGQLGSVWDDFSVPEDWIDCTKNVCSCGADLFIPKTSRVEFKPLLRQLRHPPRLQLRQLPRQLPRPHLPTKPIRPCQNRRQWTRPLRDECAC